MENTPGFDQGYYQNDILVVYQGAMRTALGEGAASVCRELQDLMTMKIDDDNYDEFLYEFPKSVDRLMGRGVAPADMLQTLFNTLFVHGCRGSSRLATTLSEVRRRPIWRNYQDLGPEFRLVLINDYEEHSADKGIIANMASVGVEGGRKEIRAMAGKFKRKAASTGSASGASASSSRPEATVMHLICNNCLGQHFMSQCPEPKRVCSKCGSEHHSERHDAVKMYEKKREERDRLKAAKSVGYKPGSPAETMAKSKSSRTPFISANIATMS
jgi:hypothetical protein